MTDTKISTVGAGPLMSSQGVARYVRAGGIIPDNAAATIASFWHGPVGNGAVFSVLSHRIERGVTLDALLSAIESARAEVAWDDFRTAALDDLAALEAWAVAKADAGE